MDRENLIWLAEKAMDNIHDMDTTISDFARAAVKALGWRKIDDEKPDTLPDDGDLMLLSDGKARWMALYSPGSDMSWRTWSGGPHVATHWLPVPDFQAVDA